MNDTGTIVAMGVGVFALRLAGSVLPTRSMPIAWARGLALVPIAVLSALVTTSLTGSGGDNGTVVAAGVAAGVAWRTKRVWASIGSGLGVWWLLGLLP